MPERPDRSESDLEPIRRLPIVREIGVALRTLAAEEDQRATDRSRRRPFLLGVLAAVAVAAPAGAAIGGLWQPDADPVPMSTVLAPPGQAKGAPQCGPPHLQAGRLVTTDQALPQALIDRFAVLRRAQRGEDRDGLRQPSARTAPGAIAAGAVRLLGKDPNGHRHWVIPTIEAPSSAGSGCPAGRSEQGWHLAVVGDDGSSTSAAYRDLLRKPTFSARNPDRRPGQSVATGIAPDGVASVTVSYPGDPGLGRTWPVAHNFFTFVVGLPEGQAASATIKWNDATSGER